MVILKIDNTRGKLIKPIQSQMETSGLWASDILHRLLTYNFFKFRKQVDMFDGIVCILLLVSTLGINKSTRTRFAQKYSIFVAKITYIIVKLFLKCGGRLTLVIVLRNSSCFYSGKNFVKQKSHQTELILFSTELSLRSTFMFVVILS